MIFDKLFKRASGPRQPLFQGVVPVEWRGEVMDVRIDQRKEHPNRDEWLAGRRRKHVWARLIPERNRNGALKCMVVLDGLTVGEIGAARFSKETALRDALNSGVNIGLVQLNEDEADRLILGAGYKYRPRPPWEA